MVLEQGRDCPEEYDHTVWWRVGFRRIPVKARSSWVWDIFWRFAGFSDGLDVGEVLGG